MSRSQSGRALIVRLATVGGHAGKKILEIIWNNHSHLGGLEKELNVNTIRTYLPVIPFIDGGCLGSNIQVASFLMTDKKT